MPATGGSKNARDGDRRQLFQLVEREGRRSVNFAFELQVPNRRIERRRHRHVGAHIKVLDRRNPGIEQRHRRLIVGWPQRSDDQFFLARGDFRALRPHRRGCEAGDGAEHRCASRQRQQVTTGNMHASAL
jgi:hypothetical protein